MASTMNWILYLLTLCIARKPSYLPDALTAKYQSNLVVRDSLIMLLTVVIFLGTLALGMACRQIAFEFVSICAVQLQGKCFFLP